MFKLVTNFLLICLAITDGQVKIFGRIVLVFIIIFIEIQQKEVQQGRDQ